MPLRAGRRGWLRVRNKIFISKVSQVLNHFSYEMGLELLFFHFLDVKLNNRIHDD